MFAKLLKCKRNSTDYLNFEDSPNLQNLHELFPVHHSKTKVKAMTLKIAPSIPSPHHHHHYGHSSSFIGDTLRPTTRTKMNSHKKRSDFAKEDSSYQTLEFADNLLNTKYHHYNDEFDDDVDQDDDGSTFNRLLKQMLDTHDEKEIQVTEKFIENPLLSSLSGEIRSEVVESQLVTESSISNKTSQNPLTTIHKTLERQIQQLSELLQRQVINAMSVLDYPTASRAIEKLFEGDSVGYTTALSFIINLVTKSVGSTISERRISLSSETIENLRRQFLRLTTALESLRRTRVKVFSRFNKQIHTTLELMIQSNEFNLELDPHTYNYNYTLLSTPKSPRARTPTRTRVEVDSIGGNLNEVGDENSYENLYWGNYSTILSSLREQKDQEEKEGNEQKNAENDRENVQNQNQSTTVINNLNEADSNSTIISTIKTNPVPPGEMEIKWEAWRRDTVNCRLSSSGSSSFDLTSFPLVPTQLSLLQGMIDLVLKNMQKAEKILKKAGEDHQQSKTILKELSRNIRLSNLNADEIHEILKVLRVSVATTATFFKGIEKSTRVSRFFISEGILHLRHSLGEIGDKRLRALTYKPNYIILVFNIKIDPHIFPEHLNNNNNNNNTSTNRVNANNPNLVKTPAVVPSKARPIPTSRSRSRSLSNHSKKSIHQISIIKEEQSEAEKESSSNLYFSENNEHKTTIIEQENISIQPPIQLNEERVKTIFSSISQELVGSGSSRKKSKSTAIDQEESRKEIQNQVQIQAQTQEQKSSDFSLPPSLTDSFSLSATPTTMVNIRKGHGKGHADVQVEMEKLRRLILDDISGAYSTLSLPNTAVWAEDGKVVPQILGLCSLLATVTTATRPYSDILPTYKNRIRGALTDLNKATNLGQKRDIIRDVGFELARINDQLETVLGLLSLNKANREVESVLATSTNTNTNVDQQDPVPGSSTRENITSSSLNDDDSGQSQTLSLAEREALVNKCSLWQVRWDNRETIIFKHTKSNKTINFGNMNLASKCEVLIAMIQFSRFMILSTGEHLKVAKENLSGVNRIFKKIIKSVEKLQQHSRRNTQTNLTATQQQQQKAEGMNLNGRKKYQFHNSSASSSRAASASSSSSMTIGQQANFAGLISKVQSTHLRAVHLMGKLNATLSQVASILFVVNNYLKLHTNWESYSQSSSSSSSSANRSRLQALTLLQVFHEKMDEAEEYIKKLYMFPITIHIPLKINPKHV